MSRPTVTVERTGLPDWERSGDYGDICYDVAEGIAKITIARPEVRNAFRPKTLFELLDAFKRAHEDMSVGVIILLLGRRPADPGRRRLCRRRRRAAAQCA